MRENEVVRAERLSAECLTLEIHCHLTPGGARQRTGRHATVPPVGPNHTSGVPNPGDFGEIAGPLFPQGWAHSLVKYLHTKL